MSTDAARAYQALRTLAAAPDQAVPFLAERLLPKKPDPQQVARLLADLDSEDFRVRSQATSSTVSLVLIGRKSLGYKLLSAEGIR